MSVPDVEQLRLDFRDAARFMEWSEADKVDIGAAIKVAIAQGDPEILACWSAWLADLAEEWRRIVARLPKPKGEQHG